MSGQDKRCRRALRLERSADMSKTQTKSLIYLKEQPLTSSVMPGRTPTGEGNALHAGIYFTLPRRSAPCYASRCR